MGSTCDGKKEKMIKEKEIITYLEYFDNNNMFVPFTYDKFFKMIMKSNTDIFKEFLIKTLDLNKYMRNNYIMFMDKELTYEHIKEHGKVVDINVKFGKGLIIDVEVNREEYSAVRDRNDLYLEKLDINNYREGTSYNKIKNNRIYQLNINASKYESKEKAVSIIVDYDIINNKIFNDRKKKYNYNLVHYYAKWYNKDKEMTYIDYFMAALYSKSYVEIYKILSNIISSNRLNKLMEGVIDMVNDGFILHEWEKEKMDKMVQDNLIELAEKRGQEQGIEQGTKTKTIEIIKNLLKQNIDYIVISNASGKTIDEIKEIEESMKEEK